MSDDLTDRQRLVIEVAVTARGAQDRDLSGVIMRKLGVSVRAFRAELAQALAHPDGPAVMEDAEIAATSPEQMPQDLLDVLLFEANWRPGIGTKIAAVRERFGFSMTAYRARLAKALAHPRATAVAPRLVAAHAQRTSPPRKRNQGGPRADG